MDDGGTGQIIYFYDRVCWSSLQAAWQSGLVSRCPDNLDPEEWRASARRLAKRLGCRVRTGLKEQTGGRFLAIAEANDGYPLGITDPYERDAYARRQADEGM